MPSVIYLYETTITQLVNIDEYITHSVFTLWQFDSNTCPRIVRCSRPRLPIAHPSPPLRVVQRSSQLHDAAEYTRSSSVQWWWFYIWVIFIFFWVDSNLRDQIHLYLFISLKTSLINELRHLCRLTATCLTLQHKYTVLSHQLQELCFLLPNGQPLSLFEQCVVPLWMAPHLLGLRLWLWLQLWLFLLSWIKIRRCKRW